MYIDWARLVGKYSDVAPKCDAAAATSYWIPAAEDEVNARLAPKYSVPFSPCPEMIADLVVDLTYYKMTYRQENQEALKTYLDERFTGLVNGTIALVVSGSVLSTGNRAWTSNDYHSSFGPDAAENWQVDEDRIDDAEDARL